ncbi:hypothetical protein D3C78_868590 [compost metagenome]
MHRIDRVHFTGVDPGLEHARTTLEPGAIVLVEILGQAFAAADDFHGEHARSLRLAARELHLGADIAGQRFARIVLGRQGVEGAVPQLDDVAQHRDVQAELVGEVVMQVGLGQPGILRDGVHAGAFETVAGEFDFGGLEYRFFVFLANAAGGFTGVGRDFKGHGRFRAGQWGRLCVDNAPTGIRQALSRQKRSGAQVPGRQRVAARLSRKLSNTRCGRRPLRVTDARLRS